MSIANFVPEVWSARILQTLQKSLVFGGIVNRDYQGEIAQYGDTVRINSIGIPTITAYTKNSSTITPEALNDSQQSLLIDKAYSFAFYVDDVDKAQAMGTPLVEGMTKAAYGLRDTADQGLAALWSQAGYISSATPVNSVNVLEAILDLGENLSAANAPREGRWLVIPPWMVTKLVLAELIVENTTNTALDNGFVGRVAGFNVYESNNVVLSTQHKIMAGTTAAITYAEQINSVEAFRPEAKFADAVKGLHLYGYKVIQPDCLAVLQATNLAEP